MNTRKILNLIGKLFLYLAFTFVIFLVIQSDNSFALKLFLIVTMGVVLGLNLLFEYLKHLYEQCQIALVIECDIKKVETLLERIKKLDILNGMKPSCILLHTLYLIDTKRPLELIDYIHDHKDFFTGHPDYLLIQYHSLFLAHAMLNHPEETKNYYSQLQRFKQTNSKKKKGISQLFNWQEIDGIFHYTTKAYKKSLHDYKAIETKHYNNRELIQYYYGRSRVELALNKHSNIKQYIQNISDLNPDSPYIGAILKIYETI